MTILDGSYILRFEGEAQEEQRYKPQVSLKQWINERLSLTAVKRGRGEDCENIV